MKKTVSAILAVCVFSWMSGVSANEQGKADQQDPESLLMCRAGNGDQIWAVSVPEDIVFGILCDAFDDICAPCIVSLEDQGCQVIDVVVTHGRQDAPYPPTTTYLLSCTSP